MANEIIGPKIKKIRKYKGITQEELAESLGYSGKSVIAHIEKGYADMTYEKMLLLLRTYMIDANALFDVERIDELLEQERKKPKHSKVIIYIHGLHGSYKEANDYTFLDEYDVVGLDYTDGNPWEVGPIIKTKFEKLIKSYKEVVVIANSIGAFYTYEYLGEYNIKHAFFISPIASMFKILFDYVITGKVNLEELKEKKFITLEDGTVLSYDFYKKYSSNDYHAKWDVPTDILYGDADNLVYIENIADFLGAHPNTKLTIKSGSEHYFHTDEEKEFIKNWILKSIK